MEFKSGDREQQQGRGEGCFLGTGLVSVNLISAGEERDHWT